MDNGTQPQYSPDHNMPKEYDFNGEPSKTERFIPEIWAERAMRALEKSTEFYPNKIIRVPRGFQTDGASVPRDAFADELTEEHFKAYDAFTARYGVKVTKPEALGTISYSPPDRASKKFYERVMGIFKKPEPQHRAKPHKMPEREPEWFKNRHISRADFARKYGR